MTYQELKIEMDKARALEAQMEQFAEWSPEWRRLFNQVLDQRCYIADLIEQDVI